MEIILENALMHRLSIGWLRVEPPANMENIRESAGALFADQLLNCGSTSRDGAHIRVCGGAPMTDRLIECDIVVEYRNLSKRPPNSGTRRGVSACPSNDRTCNRL